MKVNIVMGENKINMMIKALVVRARILAVREVMLVHANEDFVNTE